MAALLGATFSLPLLAHVLEQSVDSVRTALEPAAKAGFLAAVCDPQAGVGTQDAPWHLSEPERGPTWRFYHDRLQYAALDLLGDTKVKACETIARRLIDGSARDHSSKLVELVAFYTSQCVQAFCNLRDANSAFDYVYRAAREAIETAAYDIALTYVDTARMLHEHTSDANHESLAFELELLQCTALRPLGQLDVAREKLALLRSRAADLDAYNRCAALEIVP